MLIAREQTKVKKLQKKIRESQRDYTTMKVEKYNPLSYQGNTPDSLEGRIVAWYHKYLAHPGETRMEATPRTEYEEWSGRCRLGDTLGNVQECQINKGSTKKYGQELPPEGMEAPEPWNRGSDSGQ
jgi:hypothetical protein